MQLKRTKKDGCLKQAPLFALRAHPSHLPKPERASAKERSSKKNGHSSASSNRIYISFYKILKKLRLHYCLSRALNVQQTATTAEQPKHAQPPKKHTCEKENWYKTLCMHARLAENKRTSNRLSPFLPFPTCPPQECTSEILLPPPPPPLPPPHHHTRTTPSRLYHHHNNKKRQENDKRLRKGRISTHRL